MNNCNALTIDARGRERIGNAARDRDHAIDRAIEQVRREHAIGPVVHPPRHDQRTAEAARQRRHRMRSRGVKVNDVVAFAFENRAQLDAGRQVDRVADAQRMTFYTRRDRPLPEPSRRIANQLRAMTAAQPARSSVRAPASRRRQSRAQDRRPRCSASGASIVLLSVGTWIASSCRTVCVILRSDRINRKICNTGSRIPPSARRECRFSCPLHRSVPNTTPALRRFAIARAPPWR